MPTRDIKDTIKQIGGIASSISPILGLGTGIINLFGAKKKQSEADKLAADQRGYLAYFRQQLDNQLKQAQDPSTYPSAGPYDQYSPAWNEAATGAFRDDTAKSLQSQMAGIDYYLRPQGGAGSSAMQYAKAQAVRDAGAQNAAFMRNLRIQGGVERYNNAVKQSQDRFSRINSLLATSQGVPAMYGQASQQSQQSANDIYGGLASSIKAITALGLPGSKTGTPAAGNSTTGNNQVTPQAPWLGGTQVKGGYNPFQTYEGYAGPGTLNWGTPKQQDNTYSTGIKY